MQSRACGVSPWWLLVLRTKGTLSIKLICTCADLLETCRCVCGFSAVTPIGGNRPGQGIQGLPSLPIFLVPWRPEVPGSLTQAGTGCAVCNGT